MFPLPPVYATITVRPGNSIVASAYYDSGTGKFTLSLTNTTNGEHFTHTLIPAGLAWSAALTLYGREVGPGLV
jgi:hypothetical protein